MGGAFPAHILMESNTFCPSRRTRGSQALDVWGAFLSQDGSDDVPC